MNLKSIVVAAALGATVVVMVLTGCANRQGRSYGRYLEDRKTAYHVKNVLKDAPVYKFPDVNVTSFDRVVQLSGEVQTEDQRNRAGEIASTVPGVKEVINNLVVRPGAGALSPAGRTNAPIRMGQPAAAPTNPANPNVPEPGEPNN